MGGRGSRPIPPPPDPCEYVKRQRDDNRNAYFQKEREWAEVTHRYNVTSNELSQKAQALTASENSDRYHAGEMNRFKGLYNVDETQVIPALTAERDTLTAIVDRLRTSLGQSEYSNLIGGQLAALVTEARAELSDETVALSLDNIATKDKLYSGIRVQNNTFLNKYNEIENKFTTDDQKVFYEKQQVEFMNSLNSILSIIYVVCFIVLLSLLFFVKNENSFYYYKLPLLLGFLLYPVFIMILIDAVIYILQLAYAAANSNAYTNDY